MPRVWIYDVDGEPISQQYSSIHHDWKLAEGLAFWTKEALLRLGKKQ